MVLDISWNVAMAKFTFTIFSWMKRLASCIIALELLQLSFSIINVFGLVHRSRENHGKIHILVEMKFSDRI